MRAVLAVVKVLVLVSGGIGLITSIVHAQQAYPTRPITLTHGFAAGGNADVISRVVGEALSKRLGQPVVIEPRPGRRQQHAASQRRRLPSPASTLITLTSAHAVSAGMYKSLPFDPVDSFQFISTIGYQALIVAVRADSSIKNIADLIAAAKADPGKLTYSSVGVGSTQHLAGELLCAMAGIKMTHVPYRGGSGPMTDLLGGQIDLNIDTITVIEPQVRAGKVTALGVTSAKPWWSLPDITPVSAAVPGYDVQTWVALAAPKGMPDAINAEISANGSPCRRAGGSTRSASTSLVAGGDRAGWRTGRKWKKVVADAQIPQQ